MKRNFVVAFLILLLIAGCKKPDAYDTRGNPVRIADYQGKWVIINYWAPWCKPCLKEMPELNNLYLTYKSRLMVFGVSFDQLSNEKINTFANKLGITFPVLQNFPIEKFGIQTIQTLPVTFIISPQGKLVKTLNGPQTQVDLEAAIGFDHSKGNRIEERALSKNLQNKKP